MDTTPHLHQNIPIRFHWQTTEVREHQRSPLWYTLFAVFILSMIVVGILTKSWAMSLVFLLLAGMYVLIQMDGHSLIDVYVTDMGIQVGNRFFGYTEMTSFYVVYQPPKVTVLYIVRRGKFQVPLVIQLGTQEPSALSAYLSQQLPELAGVKERMTDRLIRLLKL